MDLYIVVGMAVLILVLTWAAIRQKQKLKEERAKTAKYNELYQLMTQWMEAKQNNQSIEK